ncbi:hypothetical protein, partial [Flavobacterium sp. XGLA_31]|uniref:hypothetical protein n=1 Tax=Flavobacterium sp. XGLA_31 TaxID=3447666 RepID=UPI003F33ACF0
NGCGSDERQVQFDVLPNPVITSANVSTTPVCIGNDVVVNLSGMADGDYTLNYDLSGSNILANQTISVSVISGNAIFIIPSTALPASGTTVITFTNIQNTVTSCQAALTNVSANILINPVVQIDNSNLSVAAACFGSPITVTLTNTTNLPDGDYQFDYSIPTGTPSTGNSGIVTITAGTGSFAIPATVFPIAGNYDITITYITTATGCS